MEAKEVTRGTRTTTSPTFEIRFSLSEITIQRENNTTSALCRSPAQRAGMENVRYQRQSAELPGSATNAADHRDLYGQLLCHFVAVLSHSDFGLWTFGTF